MPCLDAQQRLPIENSHLQADAEQTTDREWARLTRCSLPLGRIYNVPIRINYFAVAAVIIAPFVLGEFGIFLSVDIVVVVLHKIWQRLSAGRSQMAVRSILIFAPIGNIFLMSDPMRSPSEFAVYSRFSCLSHGMISLALAVSWRTVMEHQYLLILYSLRLSGITTERYECFEVNRSGN